MDLSFSDIFIGGFKRDWHALKSRCKYIVYKW